MSTSKDIMWYVECYYTDCDEIPLHKTRCYMCYLSYTMIMAGEY